MSNRKLPRSEPPPPSRRGWDTVDYALATAFALNFVAAAPLFFAPPLWITAFMPPRG